MNAHFLWLNQISQSDLAIVGGKNASLGEMLQQLEGRDTENKTINAPHAFATTACAFREFLQANKLDNKIYSLLDALDINDVARLKQSGEQIRQWILDAPFPPVIEQDLRQACRQLAEEYDDDISFAVRSSVIIEGFPEASFIGQQETCLNIKGEDELLDAIRAVFASLFNDRAVSHRVHHDFTHQQVALSATVQKMIHSDNASSGVMFTHDTESGFRDVVFMTSSYGLGEMIVQDEVNPDEFWVHKPMLEKGNPAILRRNLGSKQKKMISTDIYDYRHSTRIVEVEKNEQQRFSISDDEVRELAELTLMIEKYYPQPMKIEWAKDANDQRLYIVQAQPETVKTNANILKRYTLKEYGRIISSGHSVGQRIGAGVARIIHTPNEMERLKPGEILITDMTDSDWEPVMKRAGAIITNQGDPTSHAAITAQEQGVPAVIGCDNATEKIQDGDEITVSCAEGDTGYIYAGRLSFEVNEINLSNMPELPVRIMLNVANPERAFDFQFLPNDGVGLARLEFIINRNIGVHPRALLNYRRLSPDIQQRIDERSRGYADPVSFYIEKLVEGIATIAAAFWPKPVIVRLSDFKSNEYRNLIGGDAYEAAEENPMLGFRGASRYTDLEFQESFELECFAIKKVRDEMGLTNVAIMAPFVRTPEEAHNVINLLHDNDLRKGVNDLKIIMMCEIPANALLADRFLKYFDGFSIGSNDLTQLTLGLDRDSEKVAFLFDERNEAVKSLMSMAISSCRLKNKYVGICGQAPSDYPELALWLMERGISSLSLNPDSVVETWLYLAEHLSVNTH